MKNVLTNPSLRVNISKRERKLKPIYARVVELVDSLDSGSNVHSGRAGSSPASRTKETAVGLSLFLSVHPCQNG